MLGNHAGGKWTNFYNFIPCVAKNLPVPEFVFSLFERFTIWRLPLTRAVKVLSSVQTCGLVDVNQMFPWFSRVFQEKILSPFLEHLEENVGVEAVFAIIATGSDTASSQDNEEYESVECLSQETLSQYALPACLSSCLFRILFDNMKNDK